MTVTILPAHVDAPPATGARDGLRSAAALTPPAHTTPNGEQIHWQMGVQCWGENVAGWQIATDGPVGSDDSHQSYGVQDDPEFDDVRPFAGRPFMIRTSMRGPKPSRQDELFGQMRGRVQRRLDAMTWPAIGRELWTGEATTGDPFTIVGGLGWTNPTADDGDTWANPHFTVGNAPVVSGTAQSPTPLTPVDALGAIYEAVGDIVAGGPVLIHVPRRVLPAISWSLEHLDGGLMRIGDAFVVVSDGYQRWGPGQDSTTTDPGMWMFATGPVQVWLDDVDVYDRPVEVIDISRNKVEMWAERPALALFDPQTLIACPVAPAT